MVLVNIQPDFTEVLNDVSSQQVEKDQFWINIIEEDQVQNGHAHEEVITVTKAQDLEFSNNNGLSFTKDSEHRFSMIFKHLHFKLKIPVSSIDTNFDKVTSFDISPQEELALLGSDTGQLRLVNVKDAKEKLLIENAHFNTITHSVFFPSGKVALSVGLDLQIKIWDLSDGSCPRKFVGHKERITDIAMVDLGRNFVTSSKEGIVKLWDCATGKGITSLHKENSLKDPINTIIMTDDANAFISQRSDVEFGTSGKFLFAGHESGVITQFDLGSKKHISTFKSLFSEVKSISQKSQNKIIVGYEDGIIATWDIRNSEEPVYKVQCLPKIKTLKFNENLKSVLVSSEYGFLELIDVSHESMALSERTFVTGTEFGSEAQISSGRQNFYVINKEGTLSRIE